MVCGAEFISSMPYLRFLRVFQWGLLKNMPVSVAQRRFLKSASLSFRGVISRAYSPSPQLSSRGPPLVRYAQLLSRSLIKIGPCADDARTFIHGLVAADTKSLQYTSSSYYTAFLNAGGRILHDVFIYPPPSNFEPGTGGLRGQDEPDQYLIEVDTDRAAALIKHLKKHKLRRRLNFRLLDHEEGPVYGIWIDEQGFDPFTTLKPILEPLRCWKLDQRPNMGARCILRSKAEMEQVLGPPSASFQDYTVHRMKNGVAEGSAEIIPGMALPQESNLDLLGGIDFRKGCYLGQELTIRTHHTGTVRKRILPVQLYSSSSPNPAPSEAPIYIPTENFSLPPWQTNISQVGRLKGRIAGKWLGGVGNIGLALCRLEMTTNIKLTEETMPVDSEKDFTVAWEGNLQDIQSGELKVKFFVPQWMRLGIEEKLKTHRRDRT